MDAKEVKNRLKSARECIRSKEFKEALKHCKTVLAEDKDNYNALVFVGVSAEGLEETDKAIKAYRRAIEISPDQILAWQGLSGLYEKHQSIKSDEDLVEVYKKLSEFLSGDVAKLIDVKLKLGATYLRCAMYVQCIENLDELLTVSQDLTQYYVEIGRQLGAVSGKVMSLEDAKQVKFIQCMETLLKHSESDLENIQNAVPCYIDLLIKRGTPPDDLKTICAKLCSNFSHLSAPLDTLLILDMDSYMLQVGAWPGVDSIFKERTEILQKLHVDDSSGVLQAARGLMSFMERNFMAAKEQLSIGCELQPELVCCHYFLTWTLHLLHRNVEAIDHATCCLNLLCEKRRQLTVKSSMVEESLNFLLAKVYLEIGTVSALSTSLEYLGKLNTTDKSLITEMEGYIMLKRGLTMEAQERLRIVKEGAEKWALQGWISYHNNHYQDAADSLIKAVECVPEKSEYGVMYCKALWEIWKQKKDSSIAQKCFHTLLKTAKQDPYHSEVFEMLGYFYRDVQKDRLRSRKCFEKSFDLDGSNERSGTALCDMLTDDGKEDEAFVLLKRVTSTASAGSAKWAWLRYGLHQMKHDSLSSAVSSLQSAVRADPNDSHVWECLAEAYLHRGSFTAALKAFTKVIELNPHSLYSMYKIASIKQKLGTFKEAIEEYKLIVEKSRTFVPALKGIGETYLLLAHHQINNFRDGRAIDSCQDALTYLTRAATHRPDLSCLWKMMGDAATLCHSMDSANFRMMVPDKLLGEAGGMESAPHMCTVREAGGVESAPHMCTVGLQQTLQIGARCYGKALDLLPQCASLWHDLGVNLFYQTRTCPSELRTDISQKSYSCLKQAVTLEPENYRHWNALGVSISFEGLSNYNPKLAQHCFIKSIQAEQNNVVAWTNLATLYLNAGNVQLAHEAYKVSQSLDPSFVACWIGQAIIAETVGDQDAMDLFRHTTELGNHIESAIGYGHWVCAMLQDTSKHSTELFKYAVHHMRAIPAATDALSHYLDREKTNATAYNLHGLLLEQQGLVRSAAEAWKKSLSLMEANGDNAVQIQKVRINLARALSKLGQYRETLSLYEKCDQDDLTTQDLCYMGLIFHHASQTEQALQGMERGLKLMEKEEEKSQVLAALAMTQYKVGVKDIDSVKSSLFQSSQLVPPSVHGLLALCSLGILHKDTSLSLAVMEELRNLCDNSIQADVASLCSLYHIFLQHNSEAGIKHLEECVGKAPENGKLWLLLAQTKLCHTADSDLASLLTAAITAVDCDPHAKIPLVVLVLAELADGIHRNDLDTKKKALHNAQKLCHLFPGDKGNWCILACAVRSLASQVEDNRLLWRACFYLQWLSMEDRTNCSHLMSWIESQLMEVKEIVTRDS